MSRCEVCELQQLADLAAGRLDGREAELLRRHVAECPTCQAAVNRLERLQLALGRSEDFGEQPALPVDHARIMKAAAAMTRSRATAGDVPGSDPDRLARRATFWRRALQLTAAAAVIVVGLHFIRLFTHQNGGPPIGRVVATQGQVFTGQGEDRLAPNASLLLNQEVRTGRSSRVTLDLRGTARVELNESSALKVEAQRDGEIACRLAQGQLFVELPCSDTKPTALRIRMPAGRLETAGASFDLKVTPQSVAWRPSGSTQLTLLAAQTGPAILGDIGSQADIQLTVVDGEVDFYPSGDQSPLRLTADQQIRYGRAGLEPVRRIDTRRATLWRMPDEQLLGLAQDYLSNLFAGAAKILPGQKVSVEYRFATPAELADWQSSGGPWSQGDHAVRVRLPRGGQATLSSKASFSGDLEIEYEATVDPRQQSQLGWGLQAPPPAGPSAAATPSQLVDVSATVNAGASSAANSAGSATSSAEGAARSRLHLSVKVDGAAARTWDGQSPGPVLTFGGRLDRDQVYARLQGSDVLAAPVPDKLLRQLHNADAPLAMQPLIRVAGPDVFINCITLTGRPDHDWLRLALQRLFVAMDAQGR